MKNNSFNSNSANTRQSRRNKMRQKTNVALLRDNTRGIILTSLRAKRISSVANNENSNEKDKINREKVFDSYNWMINSKR